LRSTQTGNNGVEDNAIVDVHLNEDEDEEVVMEPSVAIIDDTFIKADTVGQPQHHKDVPVLPPHVRIAPLIETFAVPEENYGPYNLHTAAYLMKGGDANMMLLYCWELRTWEIHEPKKDASPKEEALTSGFSNTIARTPTNKSDLSLFIQTFADSCAPPLSSPSPSPRPSNSRLNSSSSAPLH
jgi:hypothetical protein